MNSVQLHLALTHVPVILSLVGMIMLIVAFFIKNTTLTRTSYILLLVAGIAALPVYFSGEATEDAIENLPGVSEAIIEKHEEVAKLAMFFIAAAGFLSLAALFTFRWQITAGVFKSVVLLLAVISGGLMAETAHLGGQIRHTEIRNDVALQDAYNASDEVENKGSNQHEETDD